MSPHHWWDNSIYLVPLVTKRRFSSTKSTVPFGTSLKKMRLFYDNWILLDANSSVATDELVKPASALAELETSIGSMWSL